MAHFFLGPFFGPVWRDVSRTFPSWRGVPLFEAFIGSAKKPKSGAKRRVHGKSIVNGSVSHLLLRHPLPGFWPGWLPPRIDGGTCQMSPVL